jgi:O-antigen ligase
MKIPAFSMPRDVNGFANILWAAALLTLPVTSFRWFPFLGEGTLVRPLSLYPLALLLPLLLIQTWRRKGGGMYWSNAFIPVGAFVLFTVTATCLGILLDVIPLRGQEYSGRAIRALVTLLIGLIFFVCAVWMNRNERNLRFSLQWIFAGLCLTILWSGLQALTFYSGLLDKEMVTHWQLAFSMRELVRTNRISGFAYEPAWLAGQLATIFIPFLFASILTNFRLSRFKWLEPVLLVFSLLILMATYSRGGLLTTIAASGLTLLFFGREALRIVWNWLSQGFRGRAADIALRLGMLLVLIGVCAGTFFFLGQKNFFRRLWEIDATSLSEYIVDINAGARGAYSAAAFAAYQEQPWSGVGMGASGFYIYQNLPDWSLTTVPEIARQLTPESRLFPNPKNLYVRLLAETGLIGFFLFLAFQFYILGDILSLYLFKQPWQRFAAVAGVFAWLAITFYNFTQDSLTTPNIWLVSGIMMGLSANSVYKEKQ